MTALSEISKKRLTEEEKRHRTQARVGLASNVLGLTAGTAALVGAAKSPALRKKVGAIIPATEAKPISRGMKAAAIGGLALQAGNMGGDMVANRVLARNASAGQPKSKVKKAGGKAAGAAAATGAAGAAGAALLRNVGEGARAGVAAEQAAKKGRKWLMPVALTTAAGAGGGGAYLVARRRNQESLKKSLGPKNDGTWTEVYISKDDHTSGRGSIVKAKRDPEYQAWVDHQEKGWLEHSSPKHHASIKRKHARLRNDKAFSRALRETGEFEKSYRRYDPEADRQRRLGLAAGAGVGGAALLGSAAAKKFTTDVSHKGDKVKGIAVRPNKGKGAILLTGGALASGGLGAYAYRRGLSERNNPWN